MRNNAIYYIVLGAVIIGYILSLYTSYRAGLIVRDLRAENEILKEEIINSKSEKFIAPCPGTSIVQPESFEDYVKRIA